MDNTHTHIRLSSWWPRQGIRQGRENTNSMHPSARIAWMMHMQSQSYPDLRPWYRELDYYHDSILSYLPCFTFIYIYGVPRQIFMDFKFRSTPVRARAMTRRFPVRVRGPNRHKRGHYGDSEFFFFFFSHFLFFPFLFLLSDFFQSYCLIGRFVPFIPR